jgi:hypothetical protein
MTEGEVGAGSTSWWVDAGSLYGVCSVGAGRQVETLKGSLAGYTGT